jgi:orotate phosphoribosyltransferase
MIRTRGLTHLALPVRDLDRAAAFYREVFGAVEAYRGPGFVQLQTPGSWDALVLEADADAVPAADAFHYGFRLLDPSDIDAAARAVVASGGEVLERGEFVPGEPYLFARDPEGYRVEIWFELPTAGDGTDPSDTDSAPAHVAPPARVTLAAFLERVAGRQGHFRLESGHHGGLWLDLDPLFADPRRVDPFVAALAEAIRPYDVEVICGPLLGGAFLAQSVAAALGAGFAYTERLSTSGDDALYSARYRLPPALGRRLRGKRVALVDDVMSAGSALRGTFAEVEAHGGVPVVAGALLVLGSAGADYFAARGVAVQAVARDGYQLWAPADCPLCAAGVPLEDVAGEAS